MYTEDKEASINLEAVQLDGRSFYDDFSKSSYNVELVFSLCLGGLMIFVILVIYRKVRREKQT